MADCGKRVKAQVLALFWRPVHPPHHPLSALRMKSVSSSSSWLPRSHQRETYPEPLTPTYITPRSAPKPPSDSAKQAFKSVFQRKPPKSPSVYSTSTTTSSDTHGSHPYSAVSMAPLPVVSNQSNPEDDEECPVCLEPLSFSFRLPGEKPHIVPECGHALHEVFCAKICTMRATDHLLSRHASPLSTGRLREALHEKQILVSAEFVGGQ